MKRLIQFTTILAVFISLIVLSTNAFCCSAFMMKGNNYCVVGFNENWKTMPGMVVVNKRGVSKQNISWNFLVSGNKTIEQEIKWISKYGSVSFNLLGIDLPCYGVNEKGLFIVELYLNKTFSLKDSLKPKMFWGQWIQYQLDNYATVNELVEGLNNTPVIDWWPTFPGSHFFVSDRAGNTAAVELINGKFQVSTGKDMPVPVLCNRPYQVDRKNLESFKTFGGNEIFNQYTQKWIDRFSKAAHLIKKYDETIDKNPISFSFNVLDSITPGQWQLVADIRNSILYFRSDISMGIKSIDISKCDFTKSSEVKYIDINSNTQGDVKNLLAKLTPEINDDYVIKGFPVGYENPEFYSSDKYVNLRRNLHKYVENQLKNIN